MLDDLEATEDVALGVDETLAVLLGDDLGDLVLLNRFVSPYLTWWVLRSSWYLSMCLTLAEMGTSFQVLNVSFALATAESNSDFVLWGTLPISSCVAYVKN